MAHRDTAGSALGLWSVGRLHKARGVPWLGNGQMCGLRVICSSGRAGVPPSCMVHTGSPGLLGGSKEHRELAGEEALEFFGDVGFVFVCLFLFSKLKGA